VSQQPAFSVFCFEGQKVPYPASSFLPDIKLSWRKSHNCQAEMIAEPEWTTAGVCILGWSKSQSQH